MKIVFLDYRSIGEDVDLTGFDRFGEVVKYNLLAPEEVGGKLDDAEIIIVNKLEISERTIGRAKKLKLVCVTATGTNNLDKEYLASRGIEWRNVAGYSTNCVAQHTFALLFYLLEKLNYYDIYVKSGQYIADKLFTHFGESFHELAEKTWGIIGMGEIGRRVAGIAKAFGCDVIYYSTSGKNDQPEYTRVALSELLAEADIISVHAPLNNQTQGLINKDAFLKMKRSAIFINVGRGPIVVEEDLAWALEEGEIAAAGLDVLVKEPMDIGNPLLDIKDSKKLLITPHIAWAGLETRQRLMDIIEHQIQEFVSAER